MCARKVQELGTDDGVVELTQQIGRFNYDGGKFASLLAKSHPEDFALAQTRDAEFVEPDYALTTYTDPEVSENYPQTHRVALFFSGLLTALFCLLWYIEDTNGDAYIVNEMIEYIMSAEIQSWLTWAIGLGLNSVPNLAEALLLFSLLMIKLQDLYLRKARADNRRAREEHDEADVSSDEMHDLFVAQQGKDEDIEAQHQADDFEPVKDNHDDDHHHHSHGTSLVPKHKKHHSHHHSAGETIKEIFLMGVTPGALGFSAAYFVLGSLPLPLRIIISLGCGVVGGAADWIKHSYFNHAAEDVDDQHPLVRTFGTNLWYTDHSFLWKLHQTWIKFIIMIHHGGAGLFNFNAMLIVTGLAAYLPSWGSILIAGLCSLPSFIFESISETYAYDSVQESPDFEIHPVTKVGLILGGIIHSLSFVVITARIYQATPENNGPYYYLINSAIFSTLSVLLLYPGTLGFYVMQRNPPIDEEGNEGLCFDDIIRLILKSPRPERQSMHYQLRSNMQFWKRGESAPRAELLPEEKTAQEEQQTSLGYRMAIAPDDEFY